MPTVTELESQLELARVAEKQAQREAEAKRKDEERARRGLELNASGEIRGLRERIDKALAAKRTPGPRPTPEARGLSRKFLHQGVDFMEIDRLAHTDPAFAEFFGLNGLCQQMSIRMQSVGVGDDALFAAVDAMEIKSWRAVVQRAEFLAGESI